MTNSVYIRVDTGTSTTISGTQTHYLQVVDPNYVEPEYTLTYTAKENYEDYYEYDLDIDWEEIREREAFRRNPIPIPVLHKQQPRFNRQILPCNNYD